MATIVTRETTQTDGTSPKGSPLTNAEVDTNFINLNDNKVEVSGAIVFAAKAGEALTKGEAVYVSGVSGNEPVVSKADADAAGKMPAFGLAETNASLNAAVNVVIVGTLYDIDTSGFATGDTVYVSTTAGALTNTKPAGESARIQNVGKVIRSHATAGSIKVAGAGRANETPNLNDGNVFIGDATNCAIARALTGDDISGGTITSFASTGIDDNAVSTAITIDSSQDVTFTSDAKFPDNGKAIFGAGSDLQIYHDGSNSVIQDSGTGDLEVQANRFVVQSASGADDFLIVTPSAGVDLRHNVSGTVGTKLATTSTGIDVTGTVTSDKAIVGYSRAAGTGGIVLYDDDQAENRLTLLTGGGTGINAVINQAGGSLNITDASLNAVATFNDGGNVGIGTTSPDYPFVVSDGGNIGFEFSPDDSNTGVNRIYSYDRGTSAYKDFKLSASQIIFGYGSSGSNEAMRIDSSGNVGIGTTTPAYLLSLKDSNGADLALSNSTASPSAGDFLGRIYALDNSDNFFAGINMFYHDANDGEIRFRVKTEGTNTDVMTLVDGNVGIGTTSPSSTLHLYGTGTPIRLNIEATTGRVESRLDNTSGAFIFGIDDSGGAGFGSAYSRNIYSNGAYPMLFWTNNAERMRIDSSGNVYIGTTNLNPVSGNVTGTTIKAQGNIQASRDNGVVISGNRKSTHGDVFEIRKDGTTVGVIGTQNWGIGTASPSVKLHVNGGTSNTLALFESTDAGAAIAFKDGNTTTNPEVDCRTNDLVFNTGNTERMRIDSSGRLLVNATNATSGGFNPSALIKQTYDGGFAVGFNLEGATADTIFGIGYNSANGAWELGPSYRTTAGYKPIAFATSGAEKMRLDTSGNLLVGTTTSGSSRLVVSKSVATGVYATKIIDTNTTAANCYGLLIDYSAAAPNGSANQFIYCEDSSALRMSVNSNGGISNYQAYDTNLSDQRAKKDIVESGDYLEKLCNISVKNFRYKEDAENSKHHLGVIAQEVEAVAPEFVNKAAWDHKGEKLDTIYNNDVMFAMLKAMQELSAQVTELKAEVAALKGA